MKNRFLLWLILGITLSCSNISQNTSRASQKRIKLPENFEIYNSELKKTEFAAGNKNFPLRIFTTINVSCATCIQKLAEWEKFQKEVKHCTKLLLVPVCVSKDKFELIKYLFENNKVGELNFPLLLDSSQTFGTLNKRFADVMSGISVLTNADNEVLLTGNPIENKADRIKFLDRICNLKTQ